jgi:nickel-type superoxide dismutase maturation protease
MFQFIKVSGDSLSPEIKEGDFVLVSKIPFSLNSLRVGDLVVFIHPDYGLLIKRIGAVSADRLSYQVTGAHPFSVDSRQFGPVDRQALVGKVIWHIRRPAR